MSDFRTPFSNRRMETELLIKKAAIVHVDGTVVIPAGTRLILRGVQGDTFGLTTEGVVSRIILEALRDAGATAKHNLHCTKISTEFGGADYSSEGVDELDEPIEGELMPSPQELPPGA